VAKPAETVDAFMARLEHPRKDEIARLRQGIRALDPPVTERIKWNAPSFCNASGDDRVTFSLQPGDRFDLILHRGSKRRDDTDSFTFADPTGRVRWAAPDRGVLTFADEADLDTRWTDTIDLVGRWMQATLD
jgi:hypothetical protein